VVLRSATDPDTLADLAALDREGPPYPAESPPLTADHLIRTGARPVWLEVDENPASAEALRERIAGDPRPRVVLVPGLGAFAAGPDARAAGIALDVTRRTLRVKAHLAAAGVAYEGLPPEVLAAQEHRGLQALKVARGDEPALARTVALVTGAAGAIGAGVCRELLAEGAHVVATDLPGERLESLSEELAEQDPGLASRVLTTPMDVTDPASVAAAFDAAAYRWGGVDLLVVNAGAAHVASLEELDPADFERLERVNVHGTLLVLSEGARRFRRQGTGGDVVLVSTKNVFAPGASFGAYSATKAAAHQLARVASQELAPLGVRVNMVAPDAVFSEGDRRSGLWAEVGPARMRARGMSEEELPEYYRNRNLLRARVTARHVGRAVVFFASRATPTTGATLPVDGGLPDATPR
jgi:NAD(P)-dependent dehydrogenase (short-subunit alcohol dehydrogenase family)